MLKAQSVQSPLLELISSVWHFDPQKREVFALHKTLWSARQVRSALFHMFKLSGDAGNEEIWQSCWWSSGRHFELQFFSVKHKKAAFPTSPNRFDSADGFMQTVFHLTFHYMKEYLWSFFLWNAKVQTAGDRICERSEKVVKLFELAPFQHWVGGGGILVFLPSH